MIRLVLLNVILLVTIGISASFPYPSDNEIDMTSDDGITFQLEDENAMASDEGFMSQSEEKKAMASNDVSLDRSEDESAWATYEDGKIATHGKLTADISQAG